MEGSLDKRRLITGAVVMTIVIATVSIVQYTGMLSPGERSAASAHVASAALAVGTSSDHVSDAGGVSGEVDINTADLLALSTLEGIGPSKAKAIVEDRERNGPFYAIEDIMRVKGIGQAMFERIRDEITVGDIASPPGSSPVLSGGTESPSSAAHEQSQDGSGTAGRETTQDAIAPGETASQDSTPPTATPKSDDTSESKSAVHSAAGTEVTPPPAGKVNINTADAAALSQLHGIGPSKSQVIISDRAENGPFYAIEDIMRVKGIGPATFDGIKADITAGDVGPRPAPPANQDAPAPQEVAPAESENAPVQEPDPPQPTIAKTGVVVITVVMPGMKGDVSYEYLEISNKESHPVDLTGWSVKKQTSGGTISTLVSSSYFDGKTIAAGGKLLLANSGGYHGATSADILWPASYSIASSNNAVHLHDSSGSTVDTASWEQIPDGEVCMRASVGSACAFAPLE